ncbi:MAG: hypothetical protein HY275_03995 [Gemmatimonadetes bacterium]|nr:hypothetical protein [Gemmatimonadota bacterium]
MTIRELVARERAVVVRSTTAWGTGAGLAAGCVVLALATWALADARWLQAPAVTPFVAWAGALALVGYGLRAGRRAARHVGDTYPVAQAMETESHTRRGAVRVALEIEAEGALGRRAAQDTAKVLAARGLVLAPETRQRLAKRLLWAGGALAVGGASLGGVAARGPDGWRALVHPVSAATGALLPRLTIDVPGPRVVRGQPARFIVHAEGRRAVLMRRRATGGAWREEELRVNEGTAAFTVAAVDADLALVATDGRATSDTARVSVVDRPFVGDVAIRAEYPAYLGRGAEALSTSEPLRVPRGTTLVIRATGTAELARAALTLGADTVPFAVKGRALETRLVAEKGGAWAWIAATGDGPIADVPVPLELEVLADSVPQVEILSPSRDTLVSVGDKVTITAAAIDDRAIAEIAMHVEKRSGSGVTPPTTERLARAPGAQWSGSVVLDLAVLGLKAGEMARVVVTAVDASPWKQEGRSRDLLLRIPSAEEQRAFARSAADSAVSMAQAAAAQQKALQQKTGDAARARGNREAGEKGKLSYEEAQKAKALADEQRQLGDKVKAAQQMAKNVESQLKQAGALDTSLQRQLGEVQKLLRDAMTPELQAQLKKLEEAGTRRDGGASREAMGDLAQQQQRLREQLERSAEMLKRAALEGSMQTLKDEAKELAQQQRQAADSLGKKDGTGGKQAADLARRTEKFGEDVKNLEQRLARERADAGSRGANEAKVKSGESAEGMKKASEQATRDASKAEQTARQAAEAMQRASDALSEARQSQVGEWKKELSEDLDRSAQEMLQMARQQQRLADRAQQGEDPKNLRGEQSALQQGMERASERMGKAGQKSSLVSPKSQRAMADARRQVEQATKQSGEGGQSGKESSDAMKQAADALNQAAASLVRDRERTNAASSASGFAEAMQEMQKLAGQQGSLNAQASSLMPTPSSGAGQQRQQAMDKARTLAQSERQIARKLEQVADADATGKAEELAREARQIAQTLETSGADKSVLDRQQRLFRRLLDAGRSMEKDDRDESGKRESRAADQAVVAAPPDKAPPSAPKLREPTWNELRGLSAEERRLVLDYYRRLNAPPDR